jgi:DNA-binding response OmpR family regulator
MRPDDHITPLARPDRLESTASPSRILVVDDDAVIRGFLGRMLRRVEYRVSCAEDGEAGWDALRADRFDVLITDHEMPRLTGLDLLRRVRAAPLNVPVILISGKIPWAETDLLRLLPPGVALAKPFAFVDLLAKVRSFLTPTIRAGGFGDGPTRREFDRHQSPPLGARVAG